MATKIITSSGQFVTRMILRSHVNSLSICAVSRANGKMIDLPDDLNTKLPIPPYQNRPDEPIQLRKARLLYQSRKRGMLENGLLLSTFAAKHLENMSLDHVQQYDRLINLPTNDWDIYYWATGVKETPVEFDNEIMQLFKKHVQNENREVRTRQPDLYSSEPAKDLFK